MAEQETLSMSVPLSAFWMKVGSAIASSNLQLRVAEGALKRACRASVGYGPMKRVERRMVEACQGRRTASVARVVRTRRVIRGRNLEDSRVMGITAGAGRLW